MRRLLRTSLALLAALAAPVPLRGQAPAIDTLAIRAHTRYLADDRLEGRGTGSRGEARTRASSEGRARVVTAASGAGGSRRRMASSSKAAPAARIDSRSS